MRLTIITLLTSAVSSCPIFAVDSAYRCDQQGINRLSDLHRERCVEEKNPEICPRLLQDIYDYMAAMHSHNDAFCQRISHRYGIVIKKAKYEPNKR